MQAIRFQSSRKTNGIARDHLEALARVIARVRDMKLDLTEPPKGFRKWLS